MRRRFSKNIYLLGLLSLFNDVTGDMITPLLPAYLATLGMGAGFLGVMEGLANSLSNITMLFAGWLADRSRKNRSLTIGGYAVSQVSRFFLAIPIPGVVMAARIFDRIGKGVHTAPRDRIITDSADKARWGQAFGVQRSMDHAGGLIGPPIAAWLISAYAIGYPHLFLFACVPSIVALVFIAPAIRERDGHAQEVAVEAPPKLSWRALPKPMKIYIAVVFVSALSTPSELFLILKMQKLGLLPFQIPLAWFLMTLFTMIAASLGGVLSDRWSRRRTMGIGWILFALVYLGFAWNRDLHWSWLLIAAYGFHTGLVEPAERAYPALVASESARATVLGWYYFAYGMGLLPASLIFGVLWDRVGPRPAFLLNAALTTLAVAGLFFLPSDRKMNRLGEG